MDRSEALRIAVERMANDRHLPRRSCLGCGGTAGRGLYVQCDARGVRVAVLGKPANGPAKANHDFTWSQIEREARVRQSGQLGLGW